MKIKLGLERGKVKLERHSPNWVIAFKEQEMILSKTFDNEFVAIEHVGSTSIMTIRAKPIIDILLVLPSKFDITIATERLANVGFFKGEFQREGEVFYIKGNESFHSHYIHLVKENQDWQRYVLFRDYLLSNVSEALKYESLKLRLAKMHKSDRQLYTSAKETFVEGILSKLR